MFVKIERLLQIFSRRIPLFRAISNENSEIHDGSKSYGSAFLQCVSSIYPGFHNSRHFVDVLVGTGYALFDGAVGGALFGWLCNSFSGGTRDA